MTITKFSQLDLSVRYSYADYLTWKFSERVELFKGWVYKMSPSPSADHQKISLTLTLGLSKYLSKQPCQLYYAPLDVCLLDSKKSKKNENIYTVVQPDILVLCDNTKLEKGRILGPPDLIVEILSPGNTKKEMANKFQLYEQNGVQEYWIVNTEEKYILQYVLVNAKYILHKSYDEKDTIQSVLFPKVKIALKDVFKF